MNTISGFFDIFKTNWENADKNCEYFYVYMFQMNEIEKSWIEGILLYNYSHSKITFRKGKLIFALKNWFWQLKILILLYSSLKLSYRLSKNPLLRFVWGIWFHLTHWKNPQLSPHYLVGLSLGFWAWLQSHSPMSHLVSTIWPVSPSWFGRFSFPASCCMHRSHLQEWINWFIFS